MEIKKVRKPRKLTAEYITFLCGYCKKSVHKRKTRVRTNTVHGLNYCSLSCASKFTKKGISSTGIYLADKTLATACSGHIRQHSRNVTQNWIKKCKICAFDRITEVCHIKPVSSFLKTALLKEVNDPKNLIILCPNCHKLYDNNLLSKETLKLIRT